jgi:hypothetical protein
MADSIKIADFVNYTDLRKKTELPQIEVEQIKNYARGLSDEQMRIFLAEVPYQTLMEECSRKYYSEHTTLQNIKKFM